MKKLIQTIVLTLVLALFSSLSARSNDEIVITIAGIDNYRPYSYAENNRPEGLYNDIVRELFSRAGYSVKIELLPFKRLLSMTEHGHVTGMAGTFFTPDRDKFATFLKDIPLTKINQSLFVTKGSSINSPVLNKLKGKIIGHKRGFIISPKLELGAKRGVFIKKEVESIDQLIKMLIFDRLDGFVHATNHTLYHIDKLDKGKKIQLLKPPVTDARETYVAFSKKALGKLPRDFVTAVRKAFNSMVNEGVLRDIHTKHNLAYSTPATLAPD